MKHCEMNVEYFTDTKAYSVESRGFMENSGYHIASYTY